jgi:hypothetical protein
MCPRNIMYYVRNNKKSSHLKLFHSVGTIFILCRKKCNVDWSVSCHDLESVSSHTFLTSKLKIRTPWCEKYIKILQRNVEVPPNFFTRNSDNTYCGNRGMTSSLTCANTIFTNRSLTFPHEGYWSTIAWYMFAAIL